MVGMKILGCSMISQVLGHKMLQGKLVCIQCIYVAGDGGNWSLLYVTSDVGLPRGTL